MNLPKLRTQQPGQASVLIAGCSDDSTTLYSQTVLSLGHRAFRWNDSNITPDLVSDSSLERGLSADRISRNPS